MKTLFIALTAMVVLSGCAYHSNYALCMQAQEKVSKDMVVMEAARIGALIEMTKSADPAVRNSALLLLQKNEARHFSLDCRK